MISTLELIKRLQSTSSKNERVSILMDAFESGNREFFIAAKMALNPRITFGVKKVASVEEDDGFDGGYTFDEFMGLCGDLSARKLTGNNALKVIHEAAERCSVPMWTNFYRPVLLKKVVDGVDYKTINAALKKMAKVDAEANEYIVPVFSCQLAEDASLPVHAKKLKGRKLVDIKLDGVRVLTILDKEQNSVLQFSRNGAPLVNFPAICESLLSLLPHIPASIVLDGEVVSKTFQQMMKQLNRKENVDTSDAKLALFDIIPLADFEKGLCKITQEDRHKVLSNLEQAGLFSSGTNSCVYVVPKVEVDFDTEQGRAAFEELNRQAIEAGLEGIMIKSPEAFYESRRWAAWLKMKPKISVSLKVTAINAGNADKKFKDTMGSVTCWGIDDGKEIETNVSSGFTEEFRAQVWGNHSLMLNQIIEVEADGITKSEVGDTYSLRFPRFVGFRSISGDPDTKD